MKLWKIAVAHVAAFHGNLLSQVLLYLNHGFSGGATVFTGLDVVVRPEAFSGLLWYNLLPGGVGDHRTKHGGCPTYVKLKERPGGAKWVANVWIHEDGNRQHYQKWGGSKLEGG